MFSDRRILIVDDNIDSAEMIAILLTIIGHNCMTAKRGIEALTIAASFRPEIVILDIGLPDVSGYEVARQLREILDGGFYMAALTGWAQQKDIDKAYEVGFDLHVTKPADVRKIHEIMRRAEDLLSKHSQF